MNSEKPKDQRPPLPDGVDSKYAATSKLGEVLSDTPEQVSRETAAKKHAMRVAAKADLIHTVSVAESLALATLRRDEVALPDEQSPVE